MASDRRPFSRACVKVLKVPICMCKLQWIAWDLQFVSRLKHAQILLKKFLLHRVAMNLLNELSRSNCYVLLPTDTWSSTMKSEHSEHSAVFFLFLLFYFFAKSEFSTKSCHLNQLRCTVFILKGLSTRKVILYAKGSYSGWITLAERNALLWKIKSSVSDIILREKRSNKRIVLSHLVPINSRWVIVLSAQSCR